MFVRATTLQADPTRLDEGIAFVRERVLPAAAELPGSLGMSMFVDRASNLVSVTSAWESEQTRVDADQVLTPLRARGARIMGRTQPPATELFELAVLDRRRPAEQGFWVRMTRVSIDPSQVDAAIDAYSASTVHDLGLLEGYCSAVLLVNRVDGLEAVSVTFESKRALEASRTQAESIRTAGLDKAGAQVTEVRESEIVIAGIRMPQSG